jgi:hypothetical protein
MQNACIKHVKKTVILGSFLGQKLHVLRLCATIPPSRSNGLTPSTTLALCLFENGHGFRGEINTVSAMDVGLGSENQLMPVQAQGDVAVAGAEIARHGDFTAFEHQPAFVFIAGDQDAIPASVAQGRFLLAQLDQLFIPVEQLRMGGVGEFGPIQF